MKLRFFMFQPAAEARRPTLCLDRCLRDLLQTGTAPTDLLLQAGLQQGIFDPSIHPDVGVVLPSTSFEKSIPASSEAKAFTSSMDDGPVGRSSNRLVLRRTEQEDATNGAFRASLLVTRTLPRSSQFI